MLWHGIEKRWRGSGMLNEKRDNAVTRCRVQIHPDTPPFHKFLSNGKKQKLISPSLVTSRKISIAIKNLLCAISRMLKRKTCFEMRMNNDFFFSPFLVAYRKCNEPTVPMTSISSSSFRVCILESDSACFSSAWLPFFLFNPVGQRLDDEGNHWSR